MLNHALRRTSGSNVQVTHGSPCSAAQARWWIFIARPTPLRWTPGRIPVTWLCSASSPSWRARNPNEAPTMSARFERRRDVPAGVRDRPQQLDADERDHRSPHLLEDGDDRGHLARPCRGVRISSVSSPRISPDRTRCTDVVEWSVGRRSPSRCTDCSMRWRSRVSADKHVGHGADPCHRRDRRRRARPVRASRSHGRRRTRADTRATARA